MAKKTSSQLNREIAAALAKGGSGCANCGGKGRTTGCRNCGVIGGKFSVPMSGRHGGVAHLKVAVDDEWDVAMDAILEGDPKRAAQIARRIREEHPTKNATQAFSDALREASQKVRDKFFELTESNEGLDFSDYEIGQMFTRRGSHRGSSSADSLTRAVLGDEPLYVRRLRLSPRSGDITALSDPKVAIRYHNELGIPTSKHAHALRAEALKALKNRFQMEHSRMIKAGGREYGTSSPLVSGGFHETWPSAFKDKIRFLAHGTTEIGDAIRLHQALSKTRSPAFS